MNQKEEIENNLHLKVAYCGKLTEEELACKILEINQGQGWISVSPMPLKAGYAAATPSAKNFLAVLEENYQAQIAGFYNYDKTDLEKAKRNAVIEEYQDLIAIWKSKYVPPPPSIEAGLRSKEEIRINELCDILLNTCQLLNGIKPDAVNEKWWSDWDESVLQSNIDMLRKVQPLYKKSNV